MPQFGQIIKTKNGNYKRLILDLKNYINPISGKKELFTREKLGQMTTEEYTKQEEKIMLQLNSIGIPTENDLRFSIEQDYDRNPTAQWIWVLDDSKKTHCDFCLEQEGKTFEHESDAPERPVHSHCGCQLIKCVMV